MVVGIDIRTLAVLSLAAFGAGVLNAVAGGGSFLTFPALVWAGMAPIPANATSAVVVAPGYLGSTLGFRQELSALPRSTLRQDTLVCAVGGMAGALLLLVTPASVFSGIVPWLLLLATALFALGPRIGRWVGTHHAESAAGQRWRLPALLLVAVYGGYFNGGLGILLMAMYLLVGESRLHRVNALKNLASLVLSIVSVAAFAWAGAIAWPLALPMMGAAMLGGVAGAWLAQRLPLPWVRAIVIGTGTVMTLVFFLRG